MTGLRGKVLHGIGWVGVSSVLKTVFQIGVIAILGRLVTPVEFGLIALASSIVGYANVLGRFGFSKAAVQRKELKREHLRVVFWSTTIISLFICAAFYLVSGPVGRFYNEPELPRLIQVLAWGPVISAFSSASSPILGRELRFKELTIIGVLSYVIGYGVVAIVLALLGFGPFALAFAMLAQQALQTVGIMTRAWPPLMGSFGWKHLRDLAGYATGQVMGRAADRVAKTADYLIIGRILGTSAVGLYERSYRLIDVARLRVTDAVDQVLFPALSKKQGDSGATIKPYFALHAAFLIALFPIAAFSIILAPEIIRLLLGNMWMDAVPVFQVLVIGLPLQADVRIANLVLRAIGDMKSFAVAKWMYAALVVIGCLIGARISLLAVAWFVNAAIVVHLLYLFNVISRYGRTGMWRHFRPYLAALAVAAITAVTTGIVAWAARSAGLHVIAVLALSSLAAFAATAGFLSRRTKLIDEDAREYAGWLIRRYLLRRMKGDRVQSDIPDQGTSPNAESEPDP